jgi:predicted Zn-dependent peptidase
MEKTYSLADFGVTKKEGILKNGLKVVFIEKPFAPIYAKIAMRAGAIFDPVGKSGLAHFTEHCIVGGSATHSKEELAGIIESIGGYKNATTYREYMTVQCEVAIPEHLSNVKEYFTQSLTNIYLTEKLLEKEKGVISSEIQKSQSDTDRKSAEYVREIFANGTKWGTKVLGTVETISKFTIADIEQFFTTHCVVENMLLVVAGGCTFEDIENIFGDIAFLHGEKHELPGPATPIDPQKITYIEDVPQTKIFFGFLGPEVGTREYFLLNFAVNFAHHGFTSRFYKKIRNEKGLAYAISSMGWSFDTLQYLGTSVGVPTDKVEETITAIKECYTELIEEGISQKEIDDKINTMWFSAKRTMQTAGDFVDTFTYDELFPEKDKEAIGDYPNIYNYRKTFTTAEIKEVLQKYIQLDKVYMVVSGREV